MVACAVAEREPVGHPRGSRHDAGHRAAVDGPREPEQATALSPGGHPRGDGLPDRGEERLVPGQTGGVDLGEAAADDEAVEGIGEPPVGQGVERHDLGAAGSERVQRVGVRERERPTGGDRDADGRPGGGHGDLIDRQSWGCLRHRGHGAEVDALGDGDGQRRDGTLHGRGILGDRDEAEVTVAPDEAVVPAERPDHRYPGRCDGLSQHGLVAVGRHPVEHHAGQVHRRVEGREAVDDRGD